MKKTFKDQLPVFIPEVILVAIGITFGVLLICNFPYMYSYCAQVPEFGVKGSILDFMLYIISACLVGCAAIACICMGHLFKGKDPVKWVDKATFVAGVVLLAYDIGIVSVMGGLLIRANVF